jgi:hypothetical protein
LLPLEPLSEPDPPPDDEDVALFVPASSFSLPLFSLPEHPDKKPTAAARPASSERVRCDVNGFPTSPAHRQGPRLSSCATGPCLGRANAVRQIARPSPNTDSAPVAAEIGLGRAMEIE